MELVIFVGLQAAGKSTFYQTHFVETHTLVSKDRFRNSKNPNRRQTQLIRAALEAGRSLVVDNTNPTVAERRSLIHLGHIYRAKIIGYYFTPQVHQCLERNRQRTGKARVPDIAIYATLKKLIPPAYAEGFQQLFYVRAGNATFEVCPWIINAGVVNAVTEEHQVKTPEGNPAPFPG